MAQDMTDSAGVEKAAEGDVLRRLLASRRRPDGDAVRAPQLPQPPAPTPARAAATAIGRAAERLYHLGVQPIEVTPGALTLPELPELLPNPAMLAVLQGPGDLVGVLALDPGAVTALIEIQTLGRVTARPLEQRRPTRSDAMICADFVNALLSDLATEMDGIDGFGGLAGYRYASYLDDPRPLMLMMEDKPFRSIRWQLRLGGSETREATIFLALPQPAIAGLERRPAGGGGKAEPTGTTSADKSVSAKAAAPAAKTVSLATAMQSAPIELVGVLCRRRMTLGELRGLSEGKLLHLPRVSLSEARIELPDGQLLAVGKFGEAEGCHAVRLRDRQHGARPRADLPDTAVASDRPKSVSMPPQGAQSEPPMDDLDDPDAFRDDSAGRAAAATPAAAKAAGAG